MDDITYKIRESKRAKHVNLRISPYDGLTVVIPYGFNHKKVPAIVEKKENWIKKTQAKLDKYKEFIPQDSPDDLPEKIVLNSVDEEWEVAYTDSEVKAGIKEVTSNKLQVSSNDKKKVREVLQGWVRKKAKEILVPWIGEVSDELKLPFRNVTIRNQKSRWGSCSHRKNISLNQKLIFLPPELVRYILVHELCHTKVLNHSKRFWALVEAKDPGYKELDFKVNRIAWKKYVPRWSEKI